MLNYNLRRRWPVEIAEQTDFKVPGLESPLLAFGTPEDYQSSVVDATYKKALERWNTVLRSLLQPATSGRCPAHVSHAQWNSFKLLYEWWHNKAYDSYTTFLIRDWIGQASDLQVKYHIRPRIASSRYNYLLFSLWRSEFEGENVRSRMQMYDERRSAAVEAARHRIAMQLIPVQGGVLASTNWSPSSVDKSPALASDMHHNFLSPMSAEIEPCSWISYDDKTNLPYYLWDNNLQSTVETETLRAPTYVAISHTWGRWKTNPIKDAKVNGVPWSIPENELFNVRDIPTFLRSVPVTTRYVWFDLVCIPQNMSDPVFGPRARFEIANQANIFRGASSAIAWFNWVPKWRGFQGAIEWLALVYANSDDPAAMDLGDALNESTSFANGTTHLLLYSNDSPNDRHQDMQNAQPSSWFTSLWTLQEVCLRPEILLCDRDWNLLTIGQNYAVPMDHVIALWNFAPLPNQQNLLPPCILELKELLERTGMVELPSMSPLTVLTLGNQRYCQGRRAEAIMSVVDAKAWYLDDIANQENCDSDLVLGKYPLRFVREVRQKLEGQFFATADLRYDATNIHEHGTMLPFSEKSTAHRKGMVSPYESLDHPAVRTWIVEQDGSVLLRAAGIVAGYPPIEGKDAIAHVLIPIGTPGAPERARNSSAQYHLNEYLASFWPSREKCAVCLLRQDDRIQGFIIVEEPHGNIEEVQESEMRVFRKLGIFYYNVFDEEHRSKPYTLEYPFPPSHMVHWKIL